MALTIKSRRLLSLASLIGLIFILSAFPAKAQFYDLEVRVADATALAGEIDATISIYMKNYADTVAGFEMWLVLERPDIMEFQSNTITIYDTTYFLCTAGTYPGNCTDTLDVTDSVLIYGGPTVYTNWDWYTDTVYDAISGNHSVVGTLSESWEYTSSRSIGGNGHDVKLVGQANELPPPYTRGIGFPQTGQTPLINLLADIYDISDTLTGVDRQCKIYIQADNLDNFSFSNEDGDGIGVITDTTLDTSWFDCLGWYNDSCISWEEVTGGPADSMFCCDTLTSGHLDTSKVKITNGTLTVLAGLCGDADCNGMINILDVTRLIDYLYLAGPDVCDAWAADANGNGAVNILDVTYLINYLYTGGPAPLCQ